MRPTRGPGPYGFVSPPINTIDVLADIRVGRQPSVMLDLMTLSEPVLPQQVIHLDNRHQHGEHNGEDHRAHDDDERRLQQPAKPA